MSLTNFFLDITVLMAYTLLKYDLSATKLYCIFCKFQQMIQFSEYVLKKHLDDKTKSMKHKKTIIKKNHKNV